MSEKLAEVFEQYDVGILGTRKGRGATILTTTEGSFILEPFRGNIMRLEQEYVLKQILENRGFSKMDLIIPNRDGILFTCDKYRQPFVLKKYLEGNECDMHCPADMVRGVKLLAEFHRYGKGAAEEFHQAWQRYRQEKEEKKILEIRQALLNGEELEHVARIYDIRENILLEMVQNAEKQDDGQKGMTGEYIKIKDGEITEVFERHNRELKKIYRYIGKVKKKNAFEDLFLQVFRGYYEQGEYCAKQLAEEGAGSMQSVEREHFGICHGAYNQHNILLADGKEAIVHFERFTKGNQLNDLYQFARKAMEKNHFDFGLLYELLCAYGEEISLSKEDYRYIYILFSYPEKFWKIANGYYNSNKAFLSPKHVEKLQNVIWQEAEKREMLEKFEAYPL